VKRIFFVVGMLILLAPLISWTAYKPARVLAPEWVENISCVTSTVCLDDESKYPGAFKLYENARNFVGKEVGPFQKHPRIVFCSTEACAQSFGLQSTAFAVGRWGIIIGPRGWVDYYVRHEMLHHRQGEELGFLSHLLEPKWLIEGMAYSLSDDPRRPLSEPWQQYRAAFDDWRQKVGKGNLWKEAKKL
jgi:hypothetical protein